MTVPFILLLLPGENLSITQNQTINSSLSNESLLSSNVILRLRVDLGLASSCFMLRINSGLMGNLAQVQVLPYFDTSQEMVREKRHNK